MGGSESTAHISDLQERWVPAPGLESHVEVSGFGVVRWIDGNVIIPKRAKRSGGYLYISIFIKEWRLIAYVHRLVCLAFYGDPGIVHGERKWVARHIDGNRLNNRSDNLSWGTYQENADDRVRHGRSGKGEKNVTSKLLQSQVDEIRCLYDSGKMKTVSLSRKFKISVGQVSNIIRRAHWNDDGIFQVPGEEWKRVVGSYKRLYTYEVSNFGRIRRVCVEGGFDVRKLRREKGGRNSIFLHNSSGQKLRYVDELVAEAFFSRPYGPLPEGFRWYPHHKSGNFSDDHLDNLEWHMTDKKKIEKKWTTHRYRKGDKLNVEKANEIQHRLKDGAGVRALAREYGVSPSVISMIGSGKIWNYAV